MASAWGGSDSYQYDPNTNRETQYQFTVGGQSVVGNLTWNANGTLQNLNITDPFNSANTQSCNYGYDDLARIQSYACTGGSSWNQSFAVGQFGNTSATANGGGATSFQPNWNSGSNQVNYVTPGQNWAYDASGNLTSNGTGTGTSAYGWDADNKMLTAQPYSSSKICVTYDAFDRPVETGSTSSTCTSATGFTQFVYDPLGDKLGVMNGQTVNRVRVPLPGGGFAIYGSGGSLLRYWHPDGLGNIRLASNPNQTFYGDEAFAPFGQTYAGSSTPAGVFGGLNTDTVTPLDDATFREFDTMQGRWLSPDPAGLAAVDEMNPQSLNRYAYVGNNPTTLIDPSGLHFFQPCSGTGLCNWGSGLGGGGVSCTTDGISGPCPSGGVGLNGEFNATGINTDPFYNSKIGQWEFFGAFADGSAGFVPGSLAGLSPLDISYALQTITTAVNGARNPIDPRGLTGSTKQIYDFLTDPAGLNISSGDIGIYGNDGHSLYLVLSSAALDAIQQSLTSHHGDDLTGPWFHPGYTDWARDSNATDSLHAVWVDPRLGALLGMPGIVGQVHYDSYNPYGGLGPFFGHAGCALFHVGC